ncbi:MAG: hypothetical protein KatS3mg060_0421 [Dehalococcoidia bacterium]|nr:MAG: hypothetical protein KatS3mg060_0421 [Dehalococcoidia bacterium]
MSVYVVTDRRLAPEHQAHYFDLVRQTRDLWAEAGGLLLNRIAISIDDPSRLLGIGRWRTVEALEAARHTTPPELLDQFRAIVLDGYGNWQIYRPLREIEDFTLRPHALRADLLDVPPEDVERFITASRSFQERIIHVPGIAAIRLLQSITDPTRILGISEVADDSAHEVRRALLAEIGRAFPNVRSVSFAGRIGSQWELPTIPRRT